MRKIILGIIVAVVGLLSAEVARAATVQVDLNNLGPAGTVFGPCYCGTGPYYSYAATSGETIDFGQVELLWGGPLSSPDTPPQYAYGYPDLAFIQSYVTVTYNSATNPYPTWTTALCPPDGSDCGLQPIFVDLTFTMPADTSSIQIGWFGQYNYFAPAVPEPSTWAMLLIGFAALGFTRYRHAASNRP